MLSQVFLLAEHLKRDSSWDAMFEQIYVDENGEIELIPDWEIIIFCLAT